MKFFTKSQDVRVEFDIFSGKVLVPGYRAELDSSGSCRAVPVDEEFVGEHTFTGLPKMREFLVRLRDAGMNISEWSFRQIDLRSLVKDRWEIVGLDGLDPELLIKVAETIDYELGDNGNDPVLVLRAAEESLILMSV